MISVGWERKECLFMRKRNTVHLPPNEHPQLSAFTVLQRPMPQ